MQIRVLGPLEATRGGRPVDLGPPKQRLVLAMLVCQAGRVVSADSLIDALWPGRPPASARANIQQHVLRLRKALGAQHLLSHGRLGYCLSVEHDQLDMLHFIDLVADGRRALADSDWVGAARLLRDALALWRGEPFADVGDEPALLTEIAQLSELRLDALEHRMDADLALGGHGDTVLELRQLVEKHPYRERFHEQLMLSLYRSGQRAAALEAYQNARKTLVGDLGLEPANRLRRLETAILNGEPFAGAEPEPREPTAVPHYLPADATAFAGREEHLRTLDRIAVCDGSRVVVISGMAGVGKTALAVRWGHRAAGRFPDGQLYVNLRGYAPEPPLTALTALTLFLRALGVPASAVPVELDEAAGLFRTLLDGRSMLLILDNARTAEQVRPLLPGHGACMVVVTSRDRLTGLIARDNARRLPLGLLAEAESVALLHEFLDGTAGARDRPSLTRLARACGNLPLALRIAAAKLADGSHRDLSGYVSALSADRRLARLSISGDSQSSVQAAFELSYGVLAPAAQRLFRGLSVVPAGDVGEHAAAALLGTEPDHALELLGGLADAHLCEQRGDGRFGLHDLLRQFGIEEAGRHGDDRASVVQRLGEFHLGTVNAAAALLYAHTVRIPGAHELGRTTVKFGDAAEAGQWLDAELPNLVMLIHHAARHRPKPMAWLLADALRGYFWIRRPVAEWLAAAGDGLAAAEEAGSPHAVAAMHLGWARHTVPSGGSRTPTGTCTRPCWPAARPDGTPGGRRRWASSRCHTPSAATISRRSNCWARSWKSTGGRAGGRARPSPRPTSVRCTIFWEICGARASTPRPRWRSTARRATSPARPWCWPTSGSTTDTSATWSSPGTISPRGSGSAARPATGWRRCCAASASRVCTARPESSTGRCTTPRAPPSWHARPRMRRWPRSARPTSR